MTPRTEIDSSQYEIADADIEIKENQYLNDDAEYYNAVKANPQKSSCGKNPSFSLIDTMDLMNGSTIL